MSTIGAYTKLTLTQARSEAQRLLGLISQGIDIQEDRKFKQTKNIITYKDYLEIFYFDWFRKNYKSYLHNERALMNSLKELHNKPLEWVNNKTNILSFMDTYQNKTNIKNGTYNRLLTIIKGSISRAIEYGYLEENNLIKIKMKTIEKNKIRYLDDDETLRFFNSLKILDKTIQNIILVAYYTGMRRGEIFKLCWEDIDYKTNQIVLKAQNTKTSKVRYIPINTKIKEIFENINNEKGIIFKSSKGNKDSFSNIHKSWENLTKDAQIENFRFHDLRHNFCSMLVMKGVPIYTVAQLAGHADVKTTQIYAHLSPDVKKDAIDLL